MKLILDIEANALEPSEVTRIWCACAKDVDNGTTYSFNEEQIRRGELWNLLKDATAIIGHNFIAYDYCVIEHLYPGKLNPLLIQDTLVLSRLLKYKLDDGEGHGLEAWGVRLGLPKHPSPDFQVYTPEMLEYCKQDVEINSKLYEYLRSHMHGQEWRQAIDTEMSMAWICLDMHLNGFRYDKTKADKLREELSQRLSKLDEAIVNSFPPKLAPVREITPKLTKHGTISKANLPRDWTNLTKLHAGCPFTLVRREEFNAGSPNQIVSRLSSAGWSPVEPTKSGKSWKISETNLATLPDTAPAGARLLVERILVAARVRTLTEWEEAYNENDGRIHGTFSSIGTWPGRMSHRSPNLGNVATKKSIKYKSERLRELALSYGASMRSFWICDDDSWLVGTDMEAAHVRLFAHYIDDKEFTKAVISGDKKNGTDVHTLGSKIFSHLGCDRDNHKTFIFSFFNGAGPPKVAEIFGCSLDDARKALRLYQQRYPGLDRLKRELIPRYAAQGWFPGLDGRRVYCNDEHLMFAGMLQAGEACVMKMANVLWRRELHNRSIKFKQLNLCHDEYVTELLTKQEAELTGQLQSKAIKDIGETLKLKCPLAGESKVGKNWLEIH